MDIVGQQKIKATQQRVFQAILNPEILRLSIPGCEAAEYVDTPTERQIKLSVSPNFPGLKGPYTIFVHPTEVVPSKHIVLQTEPGNSLGSIKAICGIDLTEQASYTQLAYNAQIILKGKIAATPEFILKTALKSALDHFFKSFEKQITTITA